MPGSVLIPLGDLAGRTHEIDPPAEATVVVYCHHGVRSQRAAVYLSQLGFEKVANLAGGIDWWSQLIDPAVPRY